jgi:hypothetical protein
MTMPCVYISDVFGDDNAKGRVVSRSLWGIEGSVFPWMNTIAVKSEVDAYLNLVDQFDALRNSEAAILLNVAPRGVNREKHANGSPFGHVKFGNKHIFTTVEGLTMSLFQRFVEQELTIDVFAINDQNLAAIGLPEYQWGYVKGTQFRSYEYLPDLAHAFLTDKPLVSEKHIVPVIADDRNFVAVVDTFGNIKTTLLPNHVNHEVGQKLPVMFGNDVIEFPFYDRLKDVPDNQPGAIVGSSGCWLGEKNLRHIELVVQKVSAAEYIRQRTNVVVGPGYELVFKNK